MNFNDIDEIKSLKFIGCGKYGNVYKFNDNKIIKLYKEYGYYEYGKLSIYNIPSNKFKLLKKKQRKIVNTDLVDDIIFVDNKPVGVSSKYVNGKTLDKIRNEISLSIKKDISFQLINNAKELIDNGIYSLDYKLNNIMYSNDEKIKIIDLDDNLTKVSRLNNALLKYLSINKLKYTLSDLFSNENFNDQLFLKTLVSYDDLKGYVKRK